MAVTVEEDSNGNPYVTIYHTKRPVAEMFQEVLNIVLQRNGFETTNGTQYTLEGELTNIDCGMATDHAAVWQALQMAPLTESMRLTVSVGFELKDKATGQSVWKQAYTGSYQATTGMGDGKFFARIWSMAVEDVVRQLITNDKFRAFFETKGSNAP